MSKETGKIFVVSSEDIPEGWFQIVSTGENAEVGDNVPEGAILKFSSAEASLAERLIAIGISRGEMLQGKNILFIVNKNTQVQFFG